MRESPRRPIEDRFWERVDRSQPDGCWVWTGSLTNHGYGKISRGGREGSEVIAARMGWELAHGPVPAGMCVLHRCDNPPCVKTEPDATWPEGHLFLGSKSDNTQDMKSKHRMAVGERLPQAKLTEDDVRTIRSLAPTMTNQALADMYGVRQPAISRIVNRKRWTHVR